MAGHSHAKNVKRTKDADAKKRSLSFAKMGKIISLLAKQGGGDSDSNPSLRSVIEKAREMNVPKNNIEKAIKKGVGDPEEGEQLEEFLFEAYGPGGAAILAEGITDNKNRTMAEFKKIVIRHEGKVAEMGSVKWMFKKRGIIFTNRNLNNNDLEMMAIDLGAEDIKKKGGEINIIVSPENTDKMKKALNDKGFEVESSLVWVPETAIIVDEKERAKINEMIEDLELEEDIQAIYSNINK